MPKIDYSHYNARKDGTYGKVWTETGKCVFCDLKDKYIITEKDNIALTVNLFPYFDGHLMVIPRRHFEGFHEVSREEWISMQEVAQIGIKLLKKEMGIEDLWVLFRASGGNGAGKSVKHAHMHLIPYYQGTFEWKYADIKIPPAKLAEKLRSNL